MCYKNYKRMNMPCRMGAGGGGKGEGLKAYGYEEARIQ